MSEIISINPATLEEIGRTEITPETKVAEYVAEARAALPVWQRMSFAERGRYLLRARDYLLENIDDFAHAITVDNGKPLAACRFLGGGRCGWGRRHGRARPWADAQPPAALSASWKSW